MALLYVGLHDKELRPLAEYRGDTSAKDVALRVLTAAAGATGSKIYRFNSTKAALASDGTITAVCVASAAASDAFLTSFMGNVLTLPSRSAALDGALTRLVEQFAGTDLTSGEKFDALYSDLDRLRSSALDNIRLLMDRGEKIETIVDRTDQLVTNTQSFKRSAVSLRKANEWQARQGWIVVVVLLCMAILVWVLLRHA